MLPSALVPSIADEAPTHTFAFSILRSNPHPQFLLLLRISYVPFHLRISVLTTIVTTIATTTTTTAINTSKTNLHGPT